MGEFFGLLLNGGRCGIILLIDGLFFAAPAGRRTRELMNIPRGERYELCRSVHAEANAIISAARRDMVGGALYLAGKDAATGQYLPDTSSCSMCRRLIINAGIAKVICRTGPDTRWR